VVHRRRRRAHRAPTGAKGRNLVIADVKLLARGLDAFCRPGATAGLDGCSATALRRIWRAEHFSWWMTSRRRRFPDVDEFQHRLQLLQLAYVCHSPSSPGRWRKTASDFRCPEKIPTP